MVDKEVGKTYAKKEMKDGKSFYVFSMKEPDYTMILLSTFCSLAVVKIGGGTAQTYKDTTSGNVTICF